MPSDKRARQRAFRAQKTAQQQARDRRRRRVRRFVSALVVVGIVVGLVALFSKSPAKVVAKPKSSVTTTTLTKVAIAPVCPPAAGSAKRVTQFTKAPAICVAPKGVYDAKFVTDAGTFVVQMNAAASLAAVNNFVFLARYHYYDGIIFHRVIPGFVIQGGDPTGTGSGGPGFSWTGNTPPKSCTAAKDCYAPGDLVMANTGAPTSNGSQFFVVLPGGQTQLDNEPVYTLFGHVISGMSVVDAIGNDGSSSGTPTVTHKMDSVTITTVSS